MASSLALAAVAQPVTRRLIAGSITNSAKGQEDANRKATNRNPDFAWRSRGIVRTPRAEVSNIVALMLQRKPDLTPDQVRGILRVTARGSRTGGPCRP